MIRRSDDGKIRILSLSYGKDSLACLGAIEELGLPLDGIVHAEVWATDDIPADLPPMVEFKAKADKIIKERWGFDVEHICAMTTPDKKYGVFKRPCEGGAKLSFERNFYRRLENDSPHEGCIKGFPTVRGPWCRHLKLQSETYISRYILSSHAQEGREGGAVSSRTDRIRKQVGTLLQFRTQEATNPPISTDFLTPGGVVSQIQTAVPIGGWPRRGCQWCTGELKNGTTRQFSKKPHARGAETNIVQYLGIAADEPERIERHSKKKGIELPLVMIGWDEATARKWCEERDLLSPIYTSTARGGAGSATTRALDSSACFGKTILIYGLCF